MKKIVITGMGAVTPVGIGVEEYWKNIVAGKSGIDTIKSFDPSELAVRFAGEIKSFVYSVNNLDDEYKTPEFATRMDEWVRELILNLIQIRKEYSESK